MLDVLNMWLLFFRWKTHYINFGFWKFAYEIGVAPAKERLVGWIIPSVLPEIDLLIHTALEWVVRFEVMKQPTSIEIEVCTYFHDNFRFTFPNPLNHRTTNLTCFAAKTFLCRVDLQNGSKKIFCLLSFNPYYEKVLKMNMRL